MPDLLTHVLIGYALGTLAAERHDFHAPGHVTAAMAGALIPDLNHISAVVPPAIFIDAGIPFSWAPLQQGGGVLIIILIGTLLVDRNERRPIFGFLSLGAFSHLFLDALIRTPDGRSQSIFWPVTQYQPQTPGLYTSADLWPVTVALVFALFVWYVTNWKGTSTTDA